jgi:hypothetical protein
MTMSRIGSLAVIAVTVAGCYNAKIETGLPHSDQKIEDHWADSWIAGLVPPSAVETAEKCPNGVAKVETKLSFLNQLVGVLTLGIYTPMYIEVTCAAEAPRRVEDVEPGIDVDDGASLEEKQAALQRAAELSATSGDAVWVVFE